MRVLYNIHKYLSEIIVWQRLVEFGGQVSFSVIDLADSPCPFKLALGGSDSRGKSFVVPFIWLDHKKMGVIIRGWA